MKEFELKLNTPNKLETFKYFPQFIKNKFEMIKKLKRFDVSIPGKQSKFILF